MPSPHFVIFEKMAINLGELIFTCRIIKKKAIVINATFGEQYKKNSSISCSVQFGLAVIALNPR